MTEPTKLFKPMLATKYDVDRLNRGGFWPISAQPKLDGIRMVVHNGQALSRTLKPIPNRYIQLWVSSMKDLLEGMDGELIVGDPTAPDVYRKTNSACMSHGGEPEFVYWVFDLWNHPGIYVRRREELEARMEKALRYDSRHIRLLQETLVHTETEIIQYEQQALAQGYEGIILRKLVGEYKYGRATPKQCQLVKLKRYQDAEAVVTGFVELLHNANEPFKNELGYTTHTTHKANMVPMNTLGALVCKGRWESGKEFEVELGTGFSQADRQEIWDNRDKYIGRIAKFKYFGVGIKDRPRHPVFLGWRSRIDLDPID